LPVEPRAFRVLLILLRNPQKLLPKDELLTAVWGDTAVSENSLARSIALLRRLLGDEARDPRFIETVATVGYRWMCQVEVSEDGSGKLDSTGMENGPREEDFVETPSHREIAEAAARSDIGAVNRGQNGKQTDAQRDRLKRWLVPGALLVVGLAVAVWYLRRPLPPLRVTGEYVQITHDGHLKLLVGTDGSRLYFTRKDFPQPLAQVAISGGEIASIPTTLPGPFLQDVSPDGSSLLVSSFDGGQEKLWSLQIPAGSLRQLLTDVGVNSAAWSPDGKSVVYSTGNNDIYVVRSDGTGMRKLADVGGFATTLSWSPDGSRIRFFKERRLWEIILGRIGSARIAAWLAPLVPAMLRTLDSRRQFLRFPPPDSNPWQPSARKPMDP